MKLEAYRFEMKWEARDKNPCDYGLRHPLAESDKCRYCSTVGGRQF